MKKLVSALVLGLTLSQTPVHADTVENYKSPKEVVQEYFQNLQTGKFKELIDLFADDIVWHQPGNNVLSGTHTGKGGMGKLFAEFMKISGGTFKIDQVFEIMENGDLVTATVEFSAHQCRYMDYAMSMRGVDLMKVVDGKIKEVYLFSADQAKEDEFWGKRIPFICGTR